MGHSGYGKPMSQIIHQYGLRTQLARRLFVVTRVLLPFVLLVTSLVSSGCKTISLPAIDPVGNGIFSGQSTTLISPHGDNGYPSTAPAFQTPPEPPKCVHGSPMAGGKTGTGCKLCKGLKGNQADPRGRCGQLLLTPTRIVAPVGGEVILLGGVCGKDGYLVTNETIEWMLSPESVGQIVEVGNDLKSQRKSFFTKEPLPKVEKLGIDFARGRTSRDVGLITRGTSDPSDDLPIRKGQTWISLTSPSEGTSKVTALAPDSDAWDQRRQTATIYWVDASWQFPQPQFVNSGQRATLITKVLRADQVLPATDWLVRYRSLNPDFARIVGRTGELAEVYEARVDSNGVAVVDVINSLAPNSVTQKNGTANFSIEIIRPAYGDMPDLPIANGVVSTTWSAPELILQAGGPDTGLPGQPLNYTARVLNVGDVPTENVVLSVVIPTGMQLRQVNPQPTRNTPSGLAWDVGYLGARSAADISMILEASADSDARVIFEAAGTNVVTPPVQVPTVIQRPQLVVQILPDPNSERVEIGGEANYTIRVRNVGNQTLNNLRLVLDSDPGLVHYREGATSVSQDIGFLTPGNSIDQPAKFIVQREGDLSLRASIQGLNQVLASAQAVTRGVPVTIKRPAVSLRIESSNASNAIAVGSQVKLTCSVENQGPVPVRDLLVSIKHDLALKLIQASSGHTLNTPSQLVFWRLPELPVNGRMVYDLVFEGASATVDAQVMAQIESSDRAIQDTKNIGIPIRDASVGNAPGTTLNGGANSNLQISIEPVESAPRRGESGRFVIVVRNASQSIEQQVELRLQIPEGVTVTEVQSQSQLPYRFDSTGRILSFDPIMSMRGGEVIQFLIVLRHELVSTAKLEAFVRSTNSPNPVAAVSTIRISP